MWQHWSPVAVLVTCEAVGSPKREEGERISKRELLWSYERNEKRLTIRTVQYGIFHREGE